VITVISYIKWNFKSQASLLLYLLKGLGFLTHHASRIIHAIPTSMIPQIVWLVKGELRRKMNLCLV